jgi:putative Ca2+/H+ antiporter (TMEM165/GDT1 family)
MNLQKVISGFFFILAMTINFGFFYGDIDNPELHSVYELFVALVVSLISTVLKIGDKTQLGAVLLATSLVADIQLIAAVTVWAVTEYLSVVNVEAFAAIISLSGGALLANITSVILYIGETLKSKR